MARQRRARMVVWILRSVTVNAIVASITLGAALGTVYVLVAQTHWLGAYLIACPSHGWKGQSMRAPGSPAAGPSGAMRGSIVFTHD
jgi:hypothetical protein